MAYVPPVLKSWNLSHLLFQWGFVQTWFWPFSPGLNKVFLAYLTLASAVFLWHTLRQNHEHQKMRRHNSFKVTKYSIKIQYNNAFLALSWWRLSTSWVYIFVFLFTENCINMKFQGAERNSYGLSLFSLVLALLKRRIERQRHNSEAEWKFYLHSLQGRSWSESS